MMFNIEETKLLDGKDISMLSQHEKEVFDYFRAQGRKFGVRIRLSGSAPKNILKLAET